MLNRILFILLISTCSAFAQDKGLFLVTRNYRVRTAPEKVTIVLDSKQLQSHGILQPQQELKDFDITDGNFGKRLTKRIVDTNGDGEIDGVVIDYVFESEEPVFSFAVKSNGKPASISKANASTDPRLVVTYLRSYEQLKKEGKEITSWPDNIIESVMSLDPDPAKFDHTVAFFLNAMFVRWQETRNQAYFNYIKKWADQLIDSHGYINPKYYKVDEYKLDDLLPGRIFISLFEVTKDARYKGAAQQLRQQLQYQPRTSDGGYWHSQALPYQMWNEGVYMAGVFMMQYAKTFNEPVLYKEAMQQVNLIQEHTKDTGSGLLFHGWDESGNPIWANEETGTSPEFWSRSIGWYYMALLECIDYIPLESPDRKELGTLFRDLTKAVVKYQDPKTGLWYQVINKSYEPRNWIETSASAMFAYGLAKGYNKGIFDKSYLALAQKPFIALQREYIFFDDQGHLYMDGIVKVGSLNTKVSKGDLDYYVSTERRVNDYKGLGALLYLSMELD